LSVKAFPKSEYNCGLVFRRIEDLVVELSVLHGLCDKGKELLKVEQAISYSGKNYNLGQIVLENAKNKKL